MNPWSRADEAVEGGNEPSEAANETEERELFAGRRRAMARAGAGLAVPSLEAVLREARPAKVVRIERRAGAREAIAVAVAAACLMATLTRLPTTLPTAIGPDLDAAAARVALTPVEHAAAETCGEPVDPAESCAPREDVCDSPRASVSPAPAAVTPLPMLMSMSTTKPAAVDSDPTESCGAEESSSAGSSPGNDSLAGTCR